MRLNKEFDKFSEQELVPNLFRILDSKIQFIDRQTAEITKSYVDMESLSSSSSKSNLGNGRKVLDAVMANNERVLTKLSEFSTDTRLLLIMRFNLNNSNAPIILDLITDNKFRTLSDKELVNLLSSN